MPSANPNKFYVTTPIYYVNARPHIGHAYTTIVADVLARRHRLLGEDVFFLTGTDEHGQKIERSAAAAGIPPQQFADEVSAQFESLWKRMGITNNKFIRTTDPHHKLGAQKLFQTLYDRGFIYLSTYTGAYCVSDEAFVDAPVGTPCPDCGRLLEEVTEENFFFKLSEFQLPLLDLIESGELEIENEGRKNEVLRFLRGTARVNPSERPELYESNEKGGWIITEEAARRHLDADLAEGKMRLSAAGHEYIPGALKDLSVSRSSFTWGIPVPDEVQKAAGATQKHIIYVWLDALANYITAIGYGATEVEAQAEFAKYWPAELQLVGKEIIRFHCVYWPAFLLAAGLPLPKAITAHGWLLFDNSKMSKSKGNIVRTETILEAFGTLCPQFLKGTGFSPSVEGSSKKAASAAEGLPANAASRQGVASATPSAAPTTRALAPEGSPSGPELRPPTDHERDLFASDVLRYFLLREIPFGQDGSFSFDALITRYNADLANGYGNLVSRTLKMISDYYDGVVAPNDPFGTSDWEPGEADSFWGDFFFYDAQVSNVVRPHSFTPAPTNLHQLVKQNILLTQQLGDQTYLSTTSAAMTFVQAVDGVLTAKAPWKLVKNNSAEAQIEVEKTLYTAAESIRIITALLYPILPYATARVWSQLGLGDIEAAARNGELNNLQWGGLQPGTRLGPLGPIFPRADKGLAQIMTDMENNPRPDAPLKQAATPATAAPVTADPTDPAAPPAALDEPSGTLPVGGSTAHTTGPDATPSHAQAQASGIFAKEPSKPSTLDPEPSPQITIDDFVKVELRVAEIKVCERIPKADKLLRLEVDLGHETRQILSGIAEFYAPEDLIGRRIIVITNLAPRKMRGLDSHGMLLAASGPADGLDGNPAGGKPILATVGEGVPLGTRLK